MKKTIKLLAVLFISTLVLTSCEDNHDHDHDADHEHEEVNILRYTLTNTNDTNNVVTFEFNDPDGEGGADGTKQVSGTLVANATYTGVLELLYNHDGTLESVSDEIKENDAEDHEVFYINSAGMTIDTTDVDANNNPLGFETNISVGATITGSLTIAIVHEGKKPNTGINDALSGGGTTDIEVVFNI